jgi:flagellar hook-basal body complex protein FliE
MDPVKINPGRAIPGFQQQGQPARDRDDSFLNSLKSYVQGVDDQLKEADRMVSEFAVGKRHGIHEIMVASEKASVSFKLLMEIRNKLQEAYQTIMAMQF